MKETKVKRNLYYEIKEKLFEEEVYNGKIIRSKRLTRVYGLNTTRQIREQLMELLRDRVTLHKDKFISPTLHKELTGLEIKSNGRWEHSDITHDDQIFSYLMGLYVWYYGNNLNDRWGIQKTGIQTDEDIDDVIELDTSSQNSSSNNNMIKPIRDITRVTDSAIEMKVDADIAQLNKNKGILFSEFVNQVRQKELESLRNMLRDERAKEAYARHYGIPIEAIDVNTGLGSQDDASGQLPNSVFIDFNKDESELDTFSIYKDLNNKQMQQDYDTGLV